MKITVTLNKDGTAKECWCYSGVTTENQRYPVKQDYRHAARIKSLAVKTSERHDLRPPFKPDEPRYYGAVVFANPAVNAVSFEIEHEVHEGWATSKAQFLAWYPDPRDEVGEAVDSWSYEILHHWRSVEIVFEGLDEFYKPNTVPEAAWTLPGKKEEAIESWTRNNATRQWSMTMQSVTPRTTITMKWQLA